jgi:hypothetical protein
VIHNGPEINNYILAYDQKKSGGKGSSGTLGLPAILSTTTKDASDPGRTITHRLLRYCTLITHWARHHNCTLQILRKLSLFSLQPSVARPSGQNVTPNTTYYKHKQWYQATVDHFHLNPCENKSQAACRAARLSRASRHVLARKGGKTKPRVT